MTTARQGHTIEIAVRLPCTVKLLFLILTQEASQRTENNKIIPTNCMSVFILPNEALLRFSSLMLFRARIRTIMQSENHYACMLFLYMAYSYIYSGYGLVHYSTSTGKSKINLDPGFYRSWTVNIYQCAAPYFTQSTLGSLKPEINPSAHRMLVTIYTSLQYQYFNQLLFKFSKHTTITWTGY